MADDHAIFRDGLRKLLDGDDEIATQRISGALDGSRKRGPALR